MNRKFLFLQGPHGPFFQKLGRMLTASGASVARVGFNLGDRVFWQGSNFIPFLQPQSAWPAFFRALIQEQGFTDVVLYGDTRQIHAQAIQIAKELDLRIHVFEEGYIRPFWISYERDGSNGNSKLMQMTIAQMQAALSDRDPELPDAPARWGDMRQHMFWGAIYHFFVLAGFWQFKNFRPHRALSVGDEFLLYCRRLFLMPIHRWERMLATLRITYGGFPYHLVLLQLEHDASFQAHSPFTKMSDFLDLVIRGFAENAPKHHHLVFKAHPLEDGRAPISRDIRRMAADAGCSDRIHFVRGGKLAGLLNHARSVITVNSTAAQQALWRGLPLKAFGRAVYSQPEFVSQDPLSVFFNHPTRPDSRAYRVFRHYLLETSQVAGGFYSSRGRRELLRQVVDMMLMDQDPYEALMSGTAAPRQQLKLVKG